MKKTKYSTPEYKAKLGPTLIIIGIIFYGIFLVFPTCFLIYYLIKRPNILDILQNDIVSDTLPFLALIFFGYIMWIFIIFFSLIGKCLGKLKLLFNHISSINKNPYIYFRELPNNFGIGVTSLLFDSTLENEKDIVAVILDLCARKYLSLEYHGDKYTIHMLEKNPTNLLSNENYIFYALKRKTIKRINYKTWYNYCLEDGMALGLYAINTHKNKKSIKLGGLSGNEYILVDPSLKLHFPQLFSRLVNFYGKRLKTDEGAGRDADSLESILRQIRTGESSALLPRPLAISNEVACTVMEIEDIDDEFDILLLYQKKGGNPAARLLIDFAQDFIS